jgi:hypothetical protein
MEKNNMLLWAGTILVLLCILSMTTTEGFYRTEANPMNNAVANRPGVNLAATTNAGARPCANAAGRSCANAAAATPTTQTVSSSNAAPAVSATSNVTPAPVVPSVTPGAQNVVAAPRTLTAPGAASVNVVNGKAPGSAPLCTLTLGINNGAGDVAAATTAGATTAGATTAGATTAPNIGNAQQNTAPGAAAAAANIQNKPTSGKPVLSPSGLPSDLQSATNTYIPTNATFRPPASILMGAPQMGVPQLGAAPIGSMGSMQMGPRSMSRNRMPDRMPDRLRGGSCPSDDCNDDCSDDCNE